MPDSMPPGLLGNLVCPRDHGTLHEEGEFLRCAAGHSYPVVDGVPVFLIAEKAETIGIVADSLRAAATRIGAPLYLKTIGVNDAQRAEIASRWETASDNVDPVISFLVGATSGYGYLPLLGNMQQYPIPNIPVPKGDGTFLLDVGCNWGRWTVSAARKGWHSVGIDPSLGAIMAAKRAFGSKGLSMWFVCGDARFLPFRTSMFGCVYSYSVLQHFSRDDAEAALAEAGRVLTPGGIVKIQMAQKWGLRSTYVRTRRNYLEDDLFQVRYWTFPQLKASFERQIGGCRIDPEGFGGLGLLTEDFRIVSLKAKVLIGASTMLRAVAKVVPPLAWMADSVFVTARKPKI